MRALRVVPRPMRGLRSRASSAPLGALIALLSAPSASALTPPLPGALALDPQVTLKLPFPAGARVRIAAGYGPAMGSSLHADTNRTNKANDHYALDLIYADEPDAGLGLPLNAALPGVVVKAGWATSGWANYGQRVILAHPLPSGAVYHTMYAHLDSIHPQIVEGAAVAQGQILGTLGRSCQGALSCGSFSLPHVHFVLHQDSAVGGSGTGGSYGGNAVVPEPLDGNEDLLRGDEFTSTNVEVAICGDGFCTQEEQTCPEDCPTCQSIPAEGRTVDDDELCFTRGGNPAYWREEQSGFGGRLFWTHATDDPQPDNFAVWSLNLESAGRYRLEVFTSAPYASSVRARYQLLSPDAQGGQQELPLDQSASEGWRALGTFELRAGAHAVRLNDNTGEPFADRVSIAFDALRILPAPPIDPPDAGAMAEDIGADSGAREDLGRDLGALPDAETIDGGARNDAGRAHDAGTGSEARVDGCGCSAKGARGARYAPLLWGLLLLGLGRVRHRLCAQNHCEGQARICASKKLV